MPITDWTLELNQFAFMKLEDGTVYGVDYQNGKLKGYASVDEYVYDQQDGKCVFCGRPIKHYHHIVPRSKGGSDRPENKVGTTVNGNTIRRTEINLRFDVPSAITDS